MVNVAQTGAISHLAAGQSDCQFPWSSEQSSATIGPGPWSTVRPHRNTSPRHPAAALSSASRTRPVQPLRSSSPAWSRRRHNAFGTSVPERHWASCRWRWSPWPCWPLLLLRSPYSRRRHASQTWWTDEWAALTGCRLSRTALIRFPRAPAG